MICFAFTVKRSRYTVIEWVILNRIYVDCLPSLARNVVVWLNVFRIDMIIASKISHWHVPLSGDWILLVCHFSSIDFHLHIFKLYKSVRNVWCTAKQRQRANKIYKHFNYQFHSNGFELWKNENFKLEKMKRRGTKKQKEKFDLSNSVKKPVCLPIGRVAFARECYSIL